MSRFNFVINYIKGKDNIIADALSRQSNYTIRIEQSKINILIKNNEKLCYNTKAVLAITITINKLGFY